MKKIAIIGAGVVGATAAYYLSREENISVTVFDDGQGQATKAAAGIICPWFSKRRHKAWYRAARLGADFYPQLVVDLKADGYETDFYEQTGVYVLKKDDTKLKELYELAKLRKEESPLIGELKILDKKEAQQKFPNLQGFEHVLYASGGARVDGNKLTKKLLQASRIIYKSQKVELSKVREKLLVNAQEFDIVILAVGAWLGEVLSPLGYCVDISPQKGQLRDYYFENLASDDFPVIMPEGELDIIPFRRGKISVGATHENTMGFDLTIDNDLLHRYEVEAESYFPYFREANRVSERVGTRAYTSDFAPFLGKVPQFQNAYAASGLGSTGLTIGPLFGKELAMNILKKEQVLDMEDYPIKHYIQFK